MCGLFAIIFALKTFPPISGAYRELSGVLDGETAIAWATTLKATSGRREFLDLLRSMMSMKILMLFTLLFDFLTALANLLERFSWAFF